MYSSVTLSTFTLLCKHHHHPSPELFSSSQTGTLYPLNNNSPIPYSLQPLVAIILLSVSMNVTTLDTYVSGIVLYLSFCDWLISLCISSRFIPVIAHVRISFFHKVNNIPLYV